MTIWDILGIESTNDQTAIRRAYARQLKQHRPDKDPQGYQQLHEAFELAKQLTGEGAGSSVSEESIDTQADQVMGGAVAPYLDALLAQSETQPASYLPVWDKGAVIEEGKRLAALLAQNSHEGRQELQAYVNSRLPDSLAAREAFSLALAEALSTSDELDETLLNGVSAIMMWDLDHYRSSQLPAWLISALEWRVQKNYDNLYWEQLEYKYQHSMTDRLVWRMLITPEKPVAWWVKWVPGLIDTLRKELTTMESNHPALLDRIGPQVFILAAFNFSIGGILLNLYVWGVVSWVVGAQAERVWPELLSLWLVVGFFVLAYVPLHQRFNARPERLRVYNFLVYLLSLALLVPFVVKYFRFVTSLKTKSTGEALAVLLCFSLLVVPIAWWIWKSRAQWRILATRIVAILISFPVNFLRGMFSSLGPISVLLLILVPIAYGFIIHHVYFTR